MVALVRSVVGVATEEASVVDEGGGGAERRWKVVRPYPLLPQTSTVMFGGGYGRNHLDVTTGV